MKNTKLENEVLTNFRVVRGFRGSRRKERNEVVHLLECPRGQNASGEEQREKSSCVKQSAATR